MDEKTVTTPKGWLYSSLRKYIPNGYGIKKVLFPVIVPVVILILWQLLSYLGKENVIIPSPLQVMISWYDWIFGTQVGMLNSYSGTWFSNVYSSLIKVLQGFGLAVLLGVPTGLLLGWNRLFDRLFDSIIQLTRPIPVTAWVPFAIVLFGVSNISAIFLIFLGSFYSIVINTYQGVKETPKNLIRASKMLGADEKTILFKIVFPSATSGIFSGLRISIGAAWVALIAAEMIAVKSGLGYVLWDAYYIGRMDIVIAAMLSVGVCGFLSDWLVRILSDYALRWKKQVSHN